MSRAGNVWDRFGEIKSRVEALATFTRRRKASNLRVIIQTTLYVELARRGLWVHLMRYDFVKDAALS